VNRLILATTNAGKVIEIRAALGGIGEWSLEPLPPGLPAIEETGDTFLENAIQKARHYSKYVAELTLSDDSGLSVVAVSVNNDPRSLDFHGVLRFGVIQTCE